MICDDACIMLTVDQDTLHIATVFMRLIGIALWQYTSLASL